MTGKIQTVTKKQNVVTQVEVTYPVWQVGNTAIRYNLDKGIFQYTDDVTYDDPDWEKLDHWVDWMAYDTPHLEKAEFLARLAKLVRQTVDLNRK